MSIPHNVRASLLATLLLACAACERVTPPEHAPPPKTGSGLELPAPSAPMEVPIKQGDGRPGPAGSVPAPAQ